MAQQTLNKAGLVNKAKDLLESQLKSGAISINDVKVLAEKYARGQRQSKPQINEAQQRKAFNESVAYYKKIAGLIREASEILRKVRNHCHNNGISFDAVRKAANA